MPILVVWVTYISENTYVIPLVKDCTRIGLFRILFLKVTFIGIGLIDIQLIRRSSKTIFTMYRNFDPIHRIACFSSLVSRMWPLL